MVVTCEQVWREISNYLEGETDPALRAAMDDHFRTCKACASVLAGTRNVITLYGDERMIEVPAGFSRRLEKKIAQGVQGGRSGWSTWSAWLVPVAALLLIGVGVRVANSVTLNPPLKSEHADPGHDIPPDMPVVVSVATRTFHVAGCDFIHNKETVRTMKASEAIREGYVPCVRCMRKYLSVAGFPAGLDAEAVTADEALKESGGD
jgi:Putative zinc-finger